MGAPLKLRLDYVDKYGNQLLAPQTSGVTFDGSVITGNDLAAGINLKYTKVTVGSEEWVLFEVDDADIKAYNILVGRPGYSIQIAAQQSGSAGATGSISLELISAIDESDASNALADLTKTAVSPAHMVVRAGQVAEFEIELKTAQGLRSVADQSITLSDIQVTNPDENEAGVLA